MILSNQFLVLFLHFLTLVISCELGKSNRHVSNCQNMTRSLIVSGNGSLYPNNVYM